MSMFSKVMHCRSTAKHICIGHAKPKKPCAVPGRPQRIPDAAAEVQVYSESVGNIMVDAASARKYTHFVRLMGRSASHLTLETALQTHPQAALICEEIHATGTTLAGVTRQVRRM